jgi:hypothetical protein
MQYESLSAFLHRNGRRFDVLRLGDVIVSVRGQKDRASGRDYLGFPPGTDVQKGDTLRDAASGDELLVEATSHFEDSSGFTSFIAFYQLLGQRRQEPAHALA